jgi:LCP family protein required for cell wall assembly
MTRRSISIALVLALFAVACGGEAAPETTVTSSTSTTSTSTTLPPTTTTTTLPFAVEGAPEDLTAVIEGFYDYAYGASQTAPAVPEPVLAGIKPKMGETPLGGKASMGTFKGQGVAVVEVAGDTFLTVNDGKGWRIVGGNWPSLSVPAFYGAGPRIVAVVGSDARPGEDMATTRADSIHFVGLDGAGSGGIVGLPRDSWVPIAGHGRGKVTGSLSSGGPETMMATFGNLTGLPFEGYVLTGFKGFQNLLGSVLGGVSVEVPFPINDRWAHVNLGAGKQDLDGAEALGFARARKTVPNGDFTRSAHQGMILLGAAQAVQAMGMSAIPQLMEKSEPHLMTSLTPEQLLTFSAMAISADLGSIANVVAPGSPGWAGSASVVYLARSVDQLWADLADGRIGS